MLTEAAVNGPPLPKVLRTSAFAEARAVYFSLSNPRHLVSEDLDKRVGPRQQSHNSSNSNNDSNSSKW